MSAAAAALAADLRAVGYTVDGVEDLLGPVASAAMHREEILPARLAVARRRGEPLADVVAALLLAEPVEEAAVDIALPRSGVRALADLGLWAGGRPVLDVRPVGPGYVVSDFGEMVTGRPLAPDYVLGVGGATKTLLDATVRTPARRALDLGTGCGVQALLLADHCEQVVATDLSERALTAARSTLALSGVENVELRSGSLLDPVAGETFDLIVSNPPFVITPRVAGIPRYEYRDGGMAGDTLVRTLVAGLGPHLNPGGVAQLLANWEIPPGRTFEDVLAAWIPDDLDAWVMQREELDPAQYAEMWLRDAGRDEAAYEAMYRAWLEDFAARDVASIGFGLVTLRRPADGEVTLRRFEDVSGTANPPVGEAVAVGLAARPVTGASVLQVASDVSQEQFHSPGEPDPMVIRLRQGAGLGRTVRVGSATAAVVGACDGTLSVDALLAAVAQITRSDESELRREVLPVLDELVFTGFLSEHVAKMTIPPRS